jgi:PIN domain nuclease of toxin-antitoxin system
MNALLDTHTFLWWNLDAPQLSAKARSFIADSRNTIYFSAASAWEIAIKYGKGRLELPEPPERYVSSRLAHHNFAPLPVQISHALGVHTLPDIHADPFDRLLIVQSQLENMPLLTADSTISSYAVQILW